jgi:hypothetical protein
VSGCVQDRPDLGLLVIDEGSDLGRPKKPSSLPWAKIPAPKAQAG